MTTKQLNINLNRMKMKQIYLVIALAVGFAFQSNAQNTVEVDASATWIGFMNVFETPANGGGFVFNSGWGIPELKTVIDVGAGTLTLQPNFNTYADNPTDPFWVDQTTLEGNKLMEANTFVEDNSLVGSELTFVGSAPSNTIDPAYEVVAFIKVFNGDFSVLKEETTMLVAGETFSVNYTNVEGADAVVQYGFKVTGINANPADEGALGSVVVGAQILNTNDFDAGSITAFPNPVVSDWNVSARENITQITVFDVLGKAVLTVSPNETNYALNMSELQTGIYMAKVVTTSGNKTIKLVKR